jgi:hypothetical protein
MRTHKTALRRSRASRAFAAKQTRRKLSKAFKTEGNGWRLWSARACKAGILYGTDGNVGTLQTREPHPKQAMTPIRTRTEITDDEAQITCEAAPSGHDARQTISRCPGKVVDWVDHASEDDVLYLHVRFTDKTELCWRIGTSLVIEEADLSDWKTGNLKQLAIFAERELDSDPER